MEKGGRERGRRHFVRLLLIFSLASCSLLVPRFITNEPYYVFAYRENSPNIPPFVRSNRFILPLSSLPEGVFVDSSGLHRAAEPKHVLLSPGGGAAIPVKETSLSCDRSGFSSDVCVLRGDVRTSSSLSSIFLFAGGDPSKVSVSGGPAVVRAEKIRPYTRKWETSVMSTINELEIVILNRSAGSRHHCDVIHRVPAVVFSTGGYIGNVYHDFRDCIIPLYITSSRFNRQVVFLVVDYKKWWGAKYREVLRRLSAYPPIDFLGDNRTHCFSEVIVGLRVHGELAIDPSLTTPANQTVHDFQRLLHDAYRPRAHHLEIEKKKKKPAPARQEDPSPPAAPKLVIIFRNGSRSVENENELVELCRAVGFKVQVLRPDWRMQLADIFCVLRSSDAMIGVVGCALTHLLFMRPGAVFIQVLPLGTEWAAEANYGGPAKEIGLRYIPYRIKPSESSLSRIYDKDDPVLTDPEAIASQGWDVTKRVFLDKQTVRVDLNRFSESLTTAYQYLVTQKKTLDHSNTNET